MQRESADHVLSLWQVIVVELAVVLVISYPSAHKYVAVSLYLIPLTLTGPLRTELLETGGSPHMIPTISVILNTLKIIFSKQWWSF